MGWKGRKEGWESRGRWVQLTDDNWQRASAGTRIHVVQREVEENAVRTIEQTSSKEWNRTNHR